MQPHRQQPTRLSCPWDSPGKNTGVGCHFLLQCMKVKSQSEVAQSCPTVSNPMDCSPTGSSVHKLNKRDDNIQPWCTPSPILNQSVVPCNCCFMTCIQVSQKTGRVVWYSYLFMNFPQFVVIHRVKGFSMVNEAEVDVFLEFSCFFNDPMNVGNLISVSSDFSKSSLNIWKF